MCAPVKNEFSLKNNQNNSCLDIRTANDALLGCIFLFYTFIIWTEITGSDLWAQSTQ